MKVGVLGPLEVRGETGAIEVSGARLRRLLTILALEAPRAVSAGSLVDALWDEETPADQANALQSLVSRLRRALGDGELVQQAPGAYRLAVEPLDIDLHQFTTLAAQGRDALRANDAASARITLTAALSLWRGDLVEVAECGYADALVVRLEEQRLEATSDLIDARIRLGDAGDVVPELEGLITAHPIRERFAVLLIRALVADGRQSEALTRFERTKALLADSLGVDPSAELQAAHLEALRSDGAPPRATVSTNLRSALTSFVGRDEQLVQIGSLLASGRLVTLVGPGGAGKTRLARAAASVTIDATAGGARIDGVWIAELAPVTDPADVPQAVLGSLGVRDAILIERSATARSALTRLIDALSGRTAILVLDNCEHLIDAAAQLADTLLAQCPDLRILATSREPLGIFGEALVVVPPLDQPGPDADPKVALGFPAVELFADRAADVQPGFEVDDTTVGSVIEIVRRLDGLPLAIELAAARLRTLPVAEVERRLSDRFRLLTGGSRTAMPRHRTLRAVVEWSWDLLTEPERLLAERLAVFSGGVTTDAAQAVCGTGSLGGEDVDDVLGSLVDKSLLQIVDSHESAPRYRMLETIREFGVEQMAQRGEVGEVRLAHATYFAALVTEADPHLRAAEQLHWMNLLATERDNILAAIKFFGDDGRAQEAIDMVNLLGWYWMTIGDHGEIVTWVSFALAIPGEVAPLTRLMSEAFLAINAFAWNVEGDHDTVAAGITQLAALSNDMAHVERGAPKMMALIAPIVAMFVGETDLVGPLTERALRDEDPWVAAAVRTFRASMAENEGDSASMREDAETALAAFREIGERWGMANSLQMLGQLELMEGNLAAAAAAYGEGIELATEVGSREDIAMMRLRLAEILARLGDLDGASEQADLARSASALSGSPMEELFTHIVRVELARTTGDPDYARATRDEALERLSQLPPVHPIRSHGVAVIRASGAKIDLEAGDVEAAYAELHEAYGPAVTTRDMPIVATVGVALAMYAEQVGHPVDAAEILGAAAQLRGAEDATSLDIVALDRALGGLADGPHAADYRRGRAMSREAALQRVDPTTLHPYVT